MLRKIIVGISGGVDSAVSALLLKKKGYHVLGVFMKNWDLTDEVGHCTTANDLKDAEYVCSKLDIPLQEVSFVKEYWNSVFSDLIADYEAGLTPNPDVLCNKCIKFNSFLRYSMNKLNADAIATGHYARNSFGDYLELYDEDHPPKLLTAADSIKDQTFFLSQISNEALRKTMFPIGSLTKPKVKMIAIENGLEKIAFKKESMGICFIGSRNFPNFISEYIKPQVGRFIDIDTREIVGQHNGIHNWTIGQRCRIPGLKGAYYISKKCKSNDIFVAQFHDHPSLYSHELTVSVPHWICSEPNEFENEGELNCEFRFQHGKPLVPCRVRRLQGSSHHITLGISLRALTPGQYAVFYKGNECLGSARIEQVLSNYNTVRYSEQNPS